MISQNIEVIKNESGWILKLSDSARIISKHSTRDEAIEAARRMSKEKNLTVTAERDSEQPAEEQMKLSASQKSSSAKIPRNGSSNGSSKDSQAMLFRQRARSWREWAASHKSRSPGLSDEAISRETIYGERG